MIHVVDMFPTLAGLAGASLAGGKPLDGIDVWPTIGTGAPSPRHDLVYNAEMFRGAVRDGDWKLLWRATLPESVELYRIPDDPSEKHNLAESNPDIVARLKSRIQDLATNMAKSLFFNATMEAYLGRHAGPPAFPPPPTILPNDDAFFSTMD